MSRLLLLAVLTLALPAQAQITLTRADMARSLSRTGTVVAGEAAASPALQLLADRSGPGQTWDFTDVAFSTDVPVDTRPAVLPVPGSDLPELEAASHVVEVGDGESQAYLFFRLAETAYETLGTSSAVEIEGQPFQIVFTFAPGKLLFPLPLTSGASWTSVDTLRMAGVGDDEYFAVESVSAAVEGWGTVVTQAGSFSALKLRRQTVTTTYSDGIPGETTVENNIEFVSAGDIDVSIALDGTTAASAHLSVVTSSVSAGPRPRADAVGLELQSANPARAGAALTLAYTLPAAGEARVAAYDALGREVAVLLDGPAASAGRLVWHTGHLPAGVYTVRLHAGGFPVTLPVTLVR